MKKKLLLLALVGATTLTSLVVTGLTLSNASSFSVAADGGLVEHNLVMTTENTTVSIEDDMYLNMTTATSHGNEFRCGVGSEIYTSEGTVIKCNADDALFEISEFEEYTYLYFYVSFDFNLDVNEGENVDGYMTYKLKKDYGWDANPRTLTWSGLDAEDNYAVFTFDYQTYDASILGFKLISCNFTYSCSY